MYRSWSSCTSTSISIKHAALIFLTEQVNQPITNMIAIRCTTAYFLFAIKWNGTCNPVRVRLRLRLRVSFPFWCSKCVVCLIYFVRWLWLLFFHFEGKTPTTARRSMCDREIEKWHTHNAAAQNMALRLHHLSLNHQNLRWKYSTLTIAGGLLTEISRNGCCVCVCVWASAAPVQIVESIILHSRCFLNFACTDGVIACK